MQKTVVSPGSAGHGLRYSSRQASSSKPGPGESCREGAVFHILMATGAGEGEACAHVSTTPFFPPALERGRGLAQIMASRNDGGEA
jgi:hypothetical protein